MRQRKYYKLDKQHTFLCNLFTDFEKYDNIPEEFVSPVPEPYKLCGEGGCGSEGGVCVCVGVMAAKV